MAKVKSKKLVNIMLVIAFLGLAIAGYQTIEHYFLSSSFCNFTTNLSCDHITNSLYGEFPFESGIAVALWGVIWWIGLIYLLFRIKSKNDWEFYNFLWLILGLGFMIYLLIAELYLLPQETGVVVICPLCTVQHVFILLLFILSFKLLKKPINLYIKEIF